MGNPPAPQEAPLPRVLRARSVRWRRIITWLYSTIILIAVVQLILAGVQTAHKRDWGVNWEFIGPIVSQTRVGRLARHDVAQQKIDVNRRSSCNQTGMSIIWSLAGLVTQRLAEKNPDIRYPGIHPGIHVGMQLALAGAQPNSGGLAMPQSDMCNSDSVTPCTSSELETAVGMLACVLG